MKHRQLRSLVLVSYHPFPDRVAPPPSPPDAGWLLISALVRMSKLSCRQSWKPLSQSSAIRQATAAAGLLAGLSRWPDHCEPFQEKICSSVDSGGLLVNAFQRVRPGSLPPACRQVVDFG
eukprot:2356143-Rhodomonas_salina.2